MAEIALVVNVIWVVVDVIGKKEIKPISLVDKTVFFVVVWDV